jgi:hypothetical protein
MAPTVAPARTRDRFVQAWLASTLQSYPEQARHYLSEARDPFRNPVGETLRTALSALADELVGGFDRARVAAALGAIVRIRAVQDFTAAEAVGFVFLARGAARAAGQEAPDAGAGWLEALDARVDEMALAAFDLYARCREEIHAIGARAARRRVYVLERVQGLADDLEAPAPALGE